MKPEVTSPLIITTTSYMFMLKFNSCFSIRICNNMPCGDSFLINGNKSPRKMLRGSKVYGDSLEFIFSLDIIWN